MADCLHSFCKCLCHNEPLLRFIRYGGGAVVEFNLQFSQAQMRTITTYEKDFIILLALF